MYFQWIQKFVLILSKVITSTFKPYLVLGFFFLFNTTYSQNHHIADSLVKVLKTQELRDSVKLQVLRNIAHNQTNPDSIIYYADQLLDFARKTESNYYIHRGYFQKGDAYRLVGNLSEALKFYLKSIEAAKKAKYNSGIGNGYTTIGDVYSLNNDHKNSIWYYSQGIEILRSQNDSIFLASALLNTGDEYFNNNNLDSSQLYFEEALIIYEALQYKSGIAYSFGNLGLVYAAQNQNKLAEQHLQKAIDILTDLKDFYPIAVYFTYMADIYADKEDYLRALNYAHKSLNISIERGYKEQIRDANLKLSELYGTIKTFDKAYQYQSQYITYRDSVNNEATTQKIADLRTEFEVAQKQAEIDLLLEKDRNNQIIAGSLILVVILIGILAYELHRNNRRKLFINQKLTLQKDALKTHRDDLQNLNKTKDRFFSIISHDLRGPVNAFNGISNLIKHYVSQNDMKNLVEVTEYIDKSASQLSTLLDNLLDWAISQQGGFPYNPDKISLNEIIEENVEIFQTTAHAKGIALRVNIGDTIYLWADKNSLTTILRNLMNNALKFTNKGGSVTISAIESDQWAKIEVIDDGIGIPRKKLQSIFDLMEKKNTQGTAGEKGLGLGLQLAYDFTEMNKGRISVASEEDVGTTFTLKIPLFNAKFIQGQQKKLQSASR